MSGQKKPGAFAGGHREIEVEMVNCERNDKTFLKVNDVDMKCSVRDRIKRIGAVYRSLKGADSVRITFKDNDLDEEKFFHIGRLYFANPTARDLSDLRIQFLKSGHETNEEPDFHDYQIAFEHDPAGPIYSNQFVCVKGELQGQYQFYCSEILTGLTSLGCVA